jgi:hypothetical protein
LFWQPVVQLVGDPQWPSVPQVRIWVLLTHSFQPTKQSLQ